MIRSHKIDEINEKLEGKEVRLCGWVDSVRILRSVIFIVLRDRYGKVQTVISSKKPGFEEAKKLTQESCISINGLVKKRPKGQENPEMGNSSKVEIETNKLEIFNLCPALPFDIKNKNTEEETRLKHRFLDLRTQRMQKNIILRSKVTNSTIEFFDKQGFVYFETPELGKSTPEGARDFVVPSRNHKGKFYALPQSPQLFKQLSQISGFDKYIQIAKCFRDEDTRKDRQPEFTQIDVEMSFVEKEDVISITEKLMKHLFKKTLNIDLKIPFKRMTYDEAMKKYQRDDPDLRKETGEKFAFCWVIDFPAFEYSEEEKRYKSTHHPFTLPIPGEKGKLDFNEKSKSYAYDLVLNGSEIGGGSIRVHDSKIQEKIFEILKLSKKEVQEKFGFLINALNYGSPPHGGIALGMDRLVQLMAEEETIRDVIPFPKNKEARDIMLNAPSEISKQQLDELGIKLNK
ncbi:MAG TPA: aspartate--tRNA ligase [Candidatus Nanoarchaeia archaeon]|nr:aspartate--tRNA ligase [Candidatus Nanoarchaeia archaeon]